MPARDPHHADKSFAARLELADQMSQLSDDGGDGATYQTIDDLMRDEFWMPDQGEIND